MTIKNLKCLKKVVKRMRKSEIFKTIEASGDDIKGQGLASFDMKFVKITSKSIS